MADLKISQLTGATTPLAGTEVVPLVQSGTTKKVAVSELVKAAGQASSGTGTPATGVVHTFQESASLSTAQRLVNRNSTQAWHVAVDAAAVDDGLYALINPATGQVVLTIAPLGDAAFKLGNLAFGTAAKGVNFTANTPAAGMTSQLLNWYEEGTYTATLTTTTGSITLNSAVDACAYTRIGRQITVTGLIIVSSVSSPTGGVSLNLPFTIGNYAESSGAGGTFVVFQDAPTYATTLKEATFEEGGTSLAINMDASTIGADDQFRFSFTYFA